MTKPTPMKMGEVNSNAQRSSALIYLRVSSVGQANTDRDGDGFSIAAQKDACIRKADQLGADVLDDLHGCRRVGAKG